MTTFPDNEPTISSRHIYSGRIIDVRVDTVRLQNGRESTREIVDHAPSICVVPVDADGNVLLVRQYRKPTDGFLLEVPAGGIEEGETPEEATRRELQEEIGHTADQAGSVERVLAGPRLVLRVHVRIPGHGPEAGEPGLGRRRIH